MGGFHARGIPEIACLFLSWKGRTKGWFRGTYPYFRNPPYIIINIWHDITWYYILLYVYYLYIPSIDSSVSKKNPNQKNNELNTIINYQTFNLPPKKITGEKTHEANTEMSYLPIRIDVLNPRLKNPACSLWNCHQAQSSLMAAVAWNPWADQAQEDVWIAKMGCEVLSGGWKCYFLGAFLLSFHFRRNLELLQSRSLISYRLKKTWPENHLDVFLASERLKIWQSNAKCSRQKKTTFPGLDCGALRFSWRGWNMFFPETHVGLTCFFHLFSSFPHVFSRKDRPFSKFWWVQIEFYVVFTTKSP